LVDHDSQECVALITAIAFMQSVFGYPDEEAFRHDPRDQLGIKIVE
jgi:hypothetical protein